MRTVAIESPYAGDVEENVAYLKACIMDCLGFGESPYASHLFFTQPDLLDDLDPDQRELGIKAGFSWSAMADVRAFYVDRGISGGMREGWTEARRRGQATEFRSLERHLTTEERMSFRVGMYP